jgi:predicted nucleotide-binding protein
MAKRGVNSKDNGPNVPLELTMSPEEAAAKLACRVTEGQQLKQAPVQSQQDYEQLRIVYSKWDDYNVMLLTKMFTNRELADEYDRSLGAYAISTHWVDSYQSFSRTFTSSLTRLESIMSRLELIPVADTVQAHPQPVAMKEVKPSSVFIGHGRSKLWARVKTFLYDDHALSSFSFESESHVGESIVPILEGFLEKATFAIVILTAEDETAEGKSRARQNVIHEAGLFQGKLGFKKAVLLRQEGLDDFSNVDGLQYIGFSGDNIEQTFYDLQRVLKREGII